MGDNARRNAPAVSRSGPARPPRAPARPSGFRGLREVRKPRPRAPPLPHPAPPLYPRPTPGPFGASRLSFLPPAEAPGSHTRSEARVNSPAAETRGLSPWPSGLQVTGDTTGSRFLRAAHRDTGPEATTRQGRSANTAALRGELLEVFLLPGVHCGRNRGKKHHREERV